MAKLGDGLALRWKWQDVGGSDRGYGEKVLLEVEEFLVKTMSRNKQVFLFLCDRFIQVKIDICLFEFSRSSWLGQAFE